MELLEKFAEATEMQRESSLDPSRYARMMESRKHCAYNQSRECFLGLEVKTADLPPAAIGEWLASHPLKSGEGIWMTPFRGLSASDVSAPMDLIYLDQDCRVIDTVESFPTFQASLSTPQPQSVLALPAHSIYSSQTQAGDQLVLCVAEEMGTQLQRLNNLRNMPGAVSAAITGAVLLREKPLWSGGPGVLGLGNPHEDASSPEQPTYEMDLAQPEGTTSKPSRNWVERWWSPDPRKAPRMLARGLAAYFWNGAAPVPHGVRDISSTGLYVITEERWYPGTLVVMILQRSDHGEEIAERSIRVQSRAVRWGPDGVGLQFLLDDEMDPRLGPNSAKDAACRREFEQFLEQLKLDNDAAE
ncbi:MAG: PilZ domain-containing protein [Terracidiphilus sp.]